MWMTEGGTVWWYSLNHPSHLHLIVTMADAHVRATSHSSRQTKEHPDLWMLSHVTSYRSWVQSFNSMHIVNPWGNTTKQVSQLFITGAITVPRRRARARMLRKLCLMRVLSARIFTKLLPCCDDSVTNVAKTRKGAFVISPLLQTWHVLAYFEQTTTFASQEQVSPSLYWGHYHFPELSLIHRLFQKAPIY